MTCILAHKTRRWVQILLAERPPKSKADLNNIELNSIEFNKAELAESIMDEWSESWVLVDPFGKHSGSLFIAQEVD